MIRGGLHSLYRSPTNVLLICVYGKHASGTTSRSQNLRPALNHDRQRVRLLKGHPGSGKTAALWHAADSSGAERILYVTYSRDLAALARDYFDRYCSSHKRFEVVVLRQRSLRTPTAHKRCNFGIELQQFFVSKPGEVNPATDNAHKLGSKIMFHHYFIFEEALVPAKEFQVVTPINQLDFVQTAESALLVTFTSVKFHDFKASYGPPGIRVHFLNLLQ